jgi:hypothetical protein
MVVVTNTGISANRFEADVVAKQNGGRLPKHAVLDAYKMQGNSGAFWAREWAVKGVLIEKGKDLVDKKTGVLIPYSDIEKANKARIESGKSAIVGVNGVFFLIDPEVFTLKSGLYVPENPKFTVVENAVLEMGGRGMADPETKIAVYAAKTVLDSLPDNQIRWNYINDGVWPLVRGYYVIGLYNCRRNVDDVHPSGRFRVLSITEDAKVDAPLEQKEQPKIVIANKQEMKKLVDGAKAGLDAVKELINLQPPALQAASKMAVAPIQELIAEVEKQLGQ